MMNTFKITADEEKQIKIVGGNYIAVANKGPGAVFVSEKNKIKAGNVGVTCIEPGTTEFLAIPANYEYVKSIDKFDYVAKLFVTTSKGEDATIECAGSTSRAEVRDIISREVDTNEYETEDSDLDDSGKTDPSDPSEPTEPTDFEWAIYTGLVWSDPDGDGNHDDEVNTDSITEWFNKSNPTKTAPVAKYTDKSGKVQMTGNNGFPTFMWNSKMGDCKQILNALNADAKSDFRKYTVTIEEIEYIAYVQNGTSDLSDPDDIVDFTIVF